MAVQAAKPVRLQAARKLLQVSDGWQGFGIGSLPTYNGFAQLGGGAQLEAGLAQQGAASTYSEDYINSITSRYSAFGTGGWGGGFGRYGRYYGGSGLRNEEGRGGGGGGGGRGSHGGRGSK